MIALILPLTFMLCSCKSDSKYIPGAYRSDFVLNNQHINVKVVVDENRINEISLDDWDETAATMYPLMQPALENISQQIYEKQSTEDIIYDEANQYTSTVLLKAIEDALLKAENEK